jgi:hypothetical protein
MKDLKELMQASLKDGVEVNFDNFDFDKGNEAFNTHINGIVKKNTSKEMEKVKGEVFKTFVQELGIEANDLDGVKLWAKKMNGNTDEYKELNTKLEKELAEITEKYNLSSGELKEFKEKALYSARINKILQSGFSQDEAEFLEFKLNKEVTEENDFKTVLEEYVKENKPKTSTNRFVKRQQSNDSVVAESIRKRYPNYFKK